jgi:AbrB family looped-hinge helix DNA binding protein
VDLNYRKLGRVSFQEAEMPTKVTSDGQVTIPQTVQDHLGIGPGSEVEFRHAADGSVVLEKATADQPPIQWEKVRGSAGRGQTTDEIMAVLRGD